MAGTGGPGAVGQGRPPRIYLGAGSAGPAWASEEQSVMVLGPPRSGKTSGVVVPTVLAATGAVVAVSTKNDVLRATAPWRSRRGPCLLFDPSGTVPAPPGVEVVRWSPVPACRQWDEAMLVASAMVGAARPPGAGHGTMPNASHWDERAQALLSSLLHAGALGDEQLPTVLRWVDRHHASPALDILDAHGADVAGDLLSGIAATDAKEQSGIWSTASGVLAGYRSTAALRSTVDPQFDAPSFCDSSSTLYICAAGRHQAVLAPMVVGLLTEIRAAAYTRHARGLEGGGRPTAVVFALDEVANIAPLPDLPAMVSEGGGQGLLTLACLQDLSQARSRWGAAADGFLSLFGTTLVLPGIGDVRTLQALSALAGEEEAVVHSLSAPSPAGVSLGRRLLGAVGRGRYGQVPAPASPTITTTTRRQPRLPVDVVARGMPGMGLLVNERNVVEWVRLTPYFAHEPWRSITEQPTLAGGRQPARPVERGRVERGGAERSAGRDPGR